MLCPLLLGAVRHASLVELCFDTAHPARECAPVVLQLSRELGRLGRGSVVRYVCHSSAGYRQERAACQVFEAELHACGL